MKKKGFTLIELAISLVVIGMLLVIGAKMIKVLTVRAKYQETKDKLNAAVESVISFAGQNNRLPTQTEFLSVVRTPTDAWNKQFIYTPASELTDTLHGGICGRKTVNLTVRKCSNAACTSYIDINNVAFIVVSGGSNYNVQTGNGTIVRVYEFSTSGIDDYTGDFNRPEDYDDVVKWVTLGELKTKAGCSGYPLKIVNNELPFGFVNSSYSAAVFAEGGVPYQSGGKYRWCIEGSLPPGLSASPNTISSNCSSLSESSWGQSDTITISGTPTSAGSYSFKVFVRDNNDPTGNNDNIYQKTFVITINPQTAGGSGGGAPPGAQISFANNMSEFKQSEGNPNAVQVDTDTNTLLLGNNVYGSSGYGCFWYPSSYQLSGKTMRAYFEFKFSDVDTSSDSRQYADGFTFTVMQASNSNNVCGSAGSGLGYRNIPGKSVAAEFDIYPSPCSWGYCDPVNYNHVAVVKDGSNSHAPANSNNPSCIYNDPGCYHTSQVTWLEDAQWHTARVEIYTKCNNDCSHCNSNGNYALIKVWVDCSNCNDLTKDFTQNPTIYHCFALASEMDNVKFGFTEGTWGKTQNVKIRNFGIGFF